MNMCLILNGYQYTAVWIYKYKHIVNGNKKEILLNVDCIFILI
jgi:hypothetical protein